MSPANQCGHLGCNYRAEGDVHGRAKIYPPALIAVVVPSPGQGDSPVSGQQQAPCPSNSRSVLRSHQEHLHWLSDRPVPPDQKTLSMGDHDL